MAQGKVLSPTLRVFWWRLVFFILIIFIISIWRNICRKFIIGEESSRILTEMCSISVVDQKNVGSKGVLYFQPRRDWNIVKTSPDSEPPVNFRCQFRIKTKFLFKKKDRYFIGIRSRNRNNSHFPCERTHVFFFNESKTFTNESSPKIMNL